MKDSKTVWYYFGAAVVLMYVLFATGAMAPGNPINTASAIRMVIGFGLMAIGSALVWAQDKGYVGGKEGKFSIGYAIFFCVMAWIIGNLVLFLHP